MSPVVGVMLMLVVTIIIAAVVSGFSGTLIGGDNKETPTLSMDIKIKNTGTWAGSGFYATVTGASQPIPTNKIKITTSWSTKNPSSGAIVAGGNVTTGEKLNASYQGGGLVSKVVYDAVPFGFGPGVTGSQSVTYPYGPGQDFGNYSLMQGTDMAAVPDGADTSDENTIDGVSGASASSGYGVSTPYTYTGMAAGAAGIDGARKVLGTNWENLRAGDTVRVNIVYLPTGKVMLNKDVTVTGE